MLDGYTTTDRYPYAEPGARAWQLHPQLGQGDGRRLRRHRDLLRRRRRGPVIRTYAQGVPGPAQAARRDAGGPAGAHPLPGGPLRGPGADVRHLPHAGSAGLLQQGGPLGRSRGCRRRGATARWSRTSRSCGCPASKEEFILLSGFNPSGRDNMIALHGRALGSRPNYGGLIAYNFPKQKLVFGPRQIDARINQDPVISQQFSLWNQQGSRVHPRLAARDPDRGVADLRPAALPGRAEQGALPELRRVIVAYGNQIAMEPTLEAVARADLRRARARRRAGRARPAERRRRARRRADRGHRRGASSAPGRPGSGARRRCAGATGRPTARSRSGSRRPSASSAKPPLSVGRSRPLGDGVAEARADASSSIASEATLRAARRATCRRSEPEPPSS